MVAVEWRKVCCPVDFSVPSATAMRVAADLCRRFGAELVLLHVEPSPAKVLVTPAADAEARLATWKKQAEELGVERVKVGRARGSPAIAIVGFATDEKVDLVVMGTHGRVDREHMLTGSVTEAVVRNALCPVLAVHAEWPGVSPAQ